MNESIKKYEKTHIECLICFDFCRDSALNTTSIASCKLYTSCLYIYNVHVDSNNNT